MPHRSPLHRAFGRTRRSSRFALRYVTARWRPLPDFVIIGAQRGGTTSLYTWLTHHPGVAPSLRKEAHYFDYNHHRGLRWYRAHFALRRGDRMTGESSPFLLFHPLAPARAAAELPGHTKFIVLLRDPTDRAISQYWLWRRQGKWEDEPLEQAIELEPERLSPHQEQFARGERSHAHIAHSYVARGEYAEQLQRWFDAVGRDRVLVLESERLFADPAASAEVLVWLGLPPMDLPYPVTNGAPRLEAASPELVARMDAHFAPHNAALRAMLDRDLWRDDVVVGRRGAADADSDPDRPPVA